MHIVYAEGEGRMGYDMGRICRQDAGVSKDALVSDSILVKKRSLGFDNNTII